MEPSGQDIKGYFKLVRQRKGLFALSAISVVSLSLLAGFLLPNVYEASCTVLIEENVIKRLVKDIAVTPSMEERFRVLAYAMESRSLLMDVMEEIGIEMSGKSPAELEKLVKKFQRRTEIESTEEMDLFTVSYRDGDPVFARDFVNALVRKYIEMNVSEKREEAYGASRFLAEQMSFFKEKLDGVESGMVDFRKEKGIFVAVDERRVAEEIKDASEKIEELKILKSELNAKKKMIKKQMEDEDPYTAAALGMKPEDTLGGRLLMLQDRLNMLLTRYTETHPEAERARAEIESLKAQIREGKARGTGGGGAGFEMDLSAFTPLHQQLREELAKGEVELAALNAREQHLLRLIESKEEYLRDIPAEKKILIDLERERNTYDSIYKELVMSFGQSEVAKQMEIQDKAATFRIVDPAITPVEPVSPNRMKLLFLGIFAGLAGGFGAVVLKDNLDDSVKSVEGVKSFGLPVLAVIPTMSNEEEQRRKRLKDVFLFGFTGLYLLCVFVVIFFEVFV